MNTAHIHEQAFKRGVYDFFNGNLDNPYKPTTLWAKEWQRGFDNGYFRNLKRLKTRRNK